MKNQKIFYGWIVVAGCFAACATLGETFGSTGVYFKPLELEFGWSRGLISSAYTVFLVGYAVSVAVSGKLADRYDPRWILIPSAVLSGLGLALSNLVANIDQLRFFYFIVGVGSGAMISVPTSIVQRWFHNRSKAGVALGIVMAGAPLGQLIFSPLMNQFILFYGWRTAYLITGVLVFGIILIASLFIRPSPKKEAIELTPLIQDNISKSNPTEGWSVAKAVVTRSYIGIVYVIAGAAIAVHAINVHFVPNAIDLGTTPTEAAAMLGLLGGLAAPVRVVSGFLSSKLGWRRIQTLSTFGIAASLGWLIIAKTTSMLLGFVIIFAAFNGIRAVSQYGLLSEFFGIHSLGALTGIMSAASTLIGAAAPYVVGFIYDSTGSYVIGFSIIAGIVLSAGIVASLLKKPQIAESKIPQPI